MPQQPSSPSFLSWSAGNFSACSYSRRMGRISVSMNWRTVSRMRIWSLLSEKSIAKGVGGMLAQCGGQRHHRWTQMNADSGTQMKASDGNTGREFVELQEHV